MPQFKIILLAVWFATTPAFGVQVLDLFIDLDGFFLFEAHPRMEDTRPDQVIVADGQRWRVANHAGEFLQATTLVPDWKIRVSFFSARDAARNVEAAKKIFLFDKRSAFEFVEGRVFSRADLSEVSNRNKTVSVKNLEKIGKHLPGFKLGNSILMDDNLRYAADGQRENMLVVPTTEYFHELLLPALDKNRPEIRPGDDVNQVKTFLAYQNGVAYALGLLLETLAGASETVSPVKSLEAIQWTAETKTRGWAPLEPLHQTPRFYKRGAKLLRQVNLTLVLRGVEDGWDMRCVDRTALSEWAGFNKP